MHNLLKSVLPICIVLGLCQDAIADAISTYGVSIDTVSLIGHPAGPFYLYLEFIDGSGVGDANNTVRVNNVSLGRGSALGGPIVFGGATGSLATGVSITDSSPVNIFSQQFTAGQKLSFSLGLTSNDDSGGIPDGFTVFILDNSAVPLPTLAPGGDYFLTVALHSSGPVFNVYGSDPSRSPSVGNPVSIPAPVVTPATPSVPEPGTAWLMGIAALLWIAAITKTAQRRRPSRRLSSQ